jgi:HlyD family secretion protein
MVLLVIAGVGGWFAWEYLQQAELPEGFASGNGRIEATEFDIATKLPGRLAEVLAREGDMVESGQVAGRMDTKSQEARLKVAEAQVEQARRERDQAAAIIRQRESECALAEKELKRSRSLYKKDRGAISLEKLEQDAVALEVAKAVCVAAEAKHANAEALMEVLPAGGKVLTVLNLTDVYMTIFLPTGQAGRVAIGADARIIFDAAPDLVIPATVSFVSPRAQFTPKQVETRTEREKLMFRIKVRIASELLEQHIEKVKTGIPGVAYVRLDQTEKWPEYLKVRLPNE